MDCCGEWTGQIQLEAVLFSAGAMCLWGTRAPAPGTHHYIYSSLMSISTMGMAGIYCRSPLVVHTFSFLLITTKRWAILRWIPRCQSVMGSRYVQWFMLRPGSSRFLCFVELFAGFGYFKYSGDQLCKTRFTYQGHQKGLNKILPFNEFFLVNLSKIVSKYEERGKQAYLFVGAFGICETDFTSQAPAGDG